MNHATRSVSRADIQSDNQPACPPQLVLSGSTAALCEASASANFSSGDRISLDEMRSIDSKRREREVILPAAYRSSNLGQAANIKMVRERGAKFTASFLQISANRPFPAGSPFSAGPTDAA
jgi:hypothetical protein